MKFTSALVVVALLTKSEEVNALKINSQFIDSSNVMIKEEPAAVPTAEAKDKKLADAKAASDDVAKKANETANAKAVGDKMKAAKEKADATLAIKAEAANNLKEKTTEDGIKRNREMLDTNKAAMEKDVAAAAANKVKPADEQPPAGSTGASQGHTAGENWTIDMPNYVISGEKGPASKVSAAPTVEALEK
jgi:membrane protein involved in colicin uptake